MYIYYYILNINQYFLTGSEDFLNTSSRTSFGFFTNSSQFTCLCIQIFQDEIVEGREVFFLIVRQDNNIGVQQNVSVFINDDDGKPIHDIVCTAT